MTNQNSSEVKFHYITEDVQGMQIDCVIFFYTKENKNINKNESEQVQWN